MSARAVAAEAVPSRLSDFLELTKPRITFFVVLTGLVGFIAGTRGPLLGVDVALLVHTLVGTALVAAGTSAFNHLVEADLDRRMARTAMRPLAAGRLRLVDAFVFALALSVTGVFELYLFTNTLTAVLAAATLLSYVCAYTPLKTRSPLSLVVGAVPGALPPLGGFTAAHGTVAPIGFVLFGLVFLWQLPHFLAIGWRHRADYAQAGFRILPVLDPDGRRTGREALLWCSLLLPVAVLPFFPLHAAGPVYALGAVAVTLTFVAAGLRFARKTDDRNALTLFLVSLGWLPAVLILFVLDRVGG